jgi:hypothetical protein
MSNQVINTGTTANDGTGDTERGAWIKANANFGDLYAAQGRLINPRIIFAGDSKSQLAGGDAADSFAFWALGLAGVEYQYDSATDNCGVNGALCNNTTTTAANNGSGTATVLGFAHDTNVAVIVARVTARAAAGDNVVLWIQVGTNSLVDDTAHLASLRKVINACRTAGAKLFLVNDVPPIGTGASATTAANIGSINSRLEDWCKTQTDVKVIKHYLATIDPASTTGIPIGGTGGAAFATTKDGTHESYYGAYLEGKMMAPQIAALFRATPLRIGSKADVYQAYFGAGAYPTVGLAANLNKNPFSEGATGTDSLTKTGTASVVGSVPDGMELAGSISGNVTVTLSQVANTYLNTLLGRTDLTCVRMTISGTPTANDAIELHEYQTGTTRYPVIQNTTPIRCRIIVEANALTGTQEFSVRMSGGQILRNSNATVASNALPALTERLILCSRDSSPVPTTASPVNYIAPPNLGVKTTLRNGIACSGYIDLLYKDARFVQAVPAPLT